MGSVASGLSLESDVTGGVEEVGEVGLRVGVATFSLVLALVVVMFCSKQ